MCTLLLLRRLVEGYPLVLAMNRDELYERPSEAPTIVREQRPTVAPRDLQAGGTWIGVNDVGLIVAISNRHEGTFDSTRRSRGLLCLEALGQSSALEVKDFLEEEVAEVEYNPFNLLYCDRGRAFASHYSEELRTVELRGEVHLMANLDVDDDGQPRIRRAKELLKGEDLYRIEDALVLLKRILSDHETLEGQSICLHGESSGTVSSSIIGVTEDFPHGGLFYYSPRRPCEGLYEDYSSLLEGMTD